MLELINSMGYLWKSMLHKLTEWSYVCITTKLNSIKKFVQIFASTRLKSIFERIAKSTLSGVVTHWLLHYMWCIARCTRMDLRLSLVWFTFKMNYSPFGATCVEFIWKLTIALPQRNENQFKSWTLRSFYRKHGCRQYRIFKFKCIGRTRKLSNEQ